MTVIGRRLTGRRLSGGRKQFLTGTLWVAAGILILGLSGYGFLTLAAGRVGAVGYAVAVLAVPAGRAGRPGAVRPDRAGDHPAGQPGPGARPRRPRVRVGQLAASRRGCSALALLVLVALGAAAGRPGLPRPGRALVRAGHLGDRVRRGERAARRAGRTRPAAGVRHRGRRGRADPAAAVPGVRRRRGDRRPAVRAGGRGRFGGCVRRRAAADPPARAGSRSAVPTGRSSSPPPRRWSRRRRSRCRWRTSPR